MSEKENQKAAEPAGVARKKEILIEPTAVGSKSDASHTAPPSQQNSRLAVTVLQGYVPVMVESLSTSIRQVIDTVAAVIKPRADGPESCQVKFGVKLSAQGDVILAKLASEMNLEITVTWKR